MAVLSAALHDRAGCGLSLNRVDASVDRGAGRVLITGAGGQLATELVQTASPRRSVRALASADLDIRDRQAVHEVLRSERPDVVINTAAYNDVDGAEADASRAYQVNGEGPSNLANACAGIRARLVHISTDFVFSGERGRPYLPEDVPEPISVYGASKLQGEESVRRILGEGAVVVRTAWLHSMTGRNFVTKMLSLLRQPEPLRVVADQIGTPTWTRSLAAALWRLLDLPQVHGIQHWTDAGVASRYDFAVAVSEEALAAGLLQRASSIEPVRSSEFVAAARRPHCSVLDTHETRRALGMNPPHWRLNLRKMLRSVGRARGDS